MSNSSAGARTDWLLFVLLGFLWGSSYLFIKIGVDAGLTPFTLIMFRLLIGFCVLAAFVIAAREPLPREPVVYVHLAVLGLISILVPFSLITWAEQTAESSLAATLNSTVPLFVVLIAPLALADERFTPARVIGVAVGLLGVVLLVGFDPASLARNNLAAEIALVGSAIAYAVGGVYARRFVSGRLRPMILAAFQVGNALIMVTVLAFVFEHPLSSPLTLATGFAVLWLGIFGSGLAYLINFRLLRNWGQGGPRWWRTCCRSGALPSAGPSWARSYTPVFW